VGDSGFEPLASSASKKYDTLLEVSATCKIAANQHILRWRISRHFRRFTRVAARLLYRCDGLHPHKVREGRLSTSRLEPAYASFVLGAFHAVRSRCRRLQRAKRMRARIAYQTARNARVTVKMRRL
jgi:hypothetical protein